MPNPITGVITDWASSAINAKLQKGGKSMGDGSSAYNNGGSKDGLSGVLSGLNLNSTINKITSAVLPSSLHTSTTTAASSSSFNSGQHRNAPLASNNSAAAPPSPYGSFPPQSAVNTGNNMSGQYPGQYGGGYGGGGGGGYPPQQSMYGQPSQPGGGYPPYPGGVDPNYGGGGGYPSGAGGPAPYANSSQPGAPIGFNAGGYPSVGPPTGTPYQPNVGGPTGQYGGGPQQPPYGGGGYPPVQTTATPTPQYYGGGGGSGSYGTQQPSYGGGGGVAGPYGTQQPPYGGSGYGAPPATYGSTTMNSGNPSVRPNPNFNASATAEMLRKAMKGFGCDKHKVVQALCTISNWQRQEVAKTFKTMYGKDLINELKGELSGDFEHLVIALMEPPARYDAYQLHKAMEGLGTKESVLIEIMTTRTNAQIHELKAVYHQMYGRELERDLIGETSGHFKRLLVSLCAGGRDEGWQADQLKANQDARKLYRAGEQRLGTDESAFNAILAAQNFHHLRAVFDEYQKVSGHSIEQAVQSEFSGDIRAGLLAVVKSIRSRPAFFAELLNNSMRGLGTRDNDLIRLVVSRSEIDLADIRQQYQGIYHTSLENAIASDCSGAYKDGLITIVKGNN